LARAYIPPRCSCPAAPCMNSRCLSLPEVQLVWWESEGHGTVPHFLFVAYLPKQHKVPCISGAVIPGVSRDGGPCLSVRASTFPSAGGSCAPPPLSAASQGGPPGGGCPGPAWAAESSRSDSEEMLEAWLVSLPAMSISSSKPASQGGGLDMDSRVSCSLKRNHL
jgi:hypothetical protein